VYFHVIAEDKNVEGGWVSDSQISKQMDVLNKGFSDFRITWELISIDRTINKEWFHNVSTANHELQLAMKKALRKGGPADLDVYTVGFRSIRTLVGYAILPWGLKDPDNDGVVIMSSSLPGGTRIKRNLGHTLIHEVGHWGGLYHTFNGGCSGFGDEVSDTPAQQSAILDCPVGLDTCKNDGGPDPLHNYMSSTDDPCTDNFTPGQISRFKAVLAKYRNVLIG
ncbi:hypothetical protein AMATHDRAFT_149430, partial [Amanita thiersii Skay4041]